MTKKTAETQLMKAYSLVINDILHAWIGYRPRVIRKVVKFFVPLLSARLRELKEWESMGSIDD